MQNNQNFWKVELSFGLIVFLLLCVVGVCQRCNYDDEEPGCLPDSIAGDREKMMGTKINLVNNMKYPYIVSLQQYIEGSQGCYKHFCGGTMIAPNLVLTAAHCFDDFIESEPRIGLFGQYSYWLKQPNFYAAISPQCRHLENPEFGRMRIDEIIIHPEYNNNNSVPENDVAIVQLLGKQGKFYTGPLVDLAGASFNVSLIDKALAIGYGQVKPEHFLKYIVYPLHGGELEYLSEDFCRMILEQLDEIGANALNYQTMICYWNWKADCCDGDSGGPLLNGDVQIGIVSWGPSTQCNQTIAQQSPGVYVRLPEYTDWIDQMISIYGQEIHQRASLSSQVLKSMLEMDVLLSIPEIVPAMWKGQDPCKNWNGINCTEGNIDVLDFTQLPVFLSSIIPPELSVLQDLEVLLAPESGFYGTIPSELSAWTALKFIDLAANNLTGTLPPELSAWKNISHVDFSDNYLTGQLPPELSTWHLDRFGSLDGNFFTGKLPAEYSTMAEKKPLKLNVFPQKTQELCIDTQILELFQEYLEDTQLCSENPLNTQEQLEDSERSKNKTKKNTQQLSENPLNTQVLVFFFLNVFVACSFILCSLLYTCQNFLKLFYKRRIATLIPEATCRQLLLGEASDQLGQNSVASIFFLKRLLLIF